MQEFSDNNNTFSTIKMILFYFNKDFHSRMSFDSDTTDYKITRQRLEIRKVDDIVKRMKKLLIFDRQQLKKIKQIIKTQVNKHQKDVTYEINNQIILNFR